MADDTRKSSSPPSDLSREALTVDPSQKAFEGSQWQDDTAQPYRPPENANLMPGGTEHTAGGKAPDITMWNALRVGPPITEIHRRPCVRDSLMSGITAGFVTGGVRFIARAQVWTACNWAVGGFVATSAVLYQYCQYERQAEREGMVRAVQILNQKEIERKAREQRKDALREERRAAKDKEQDSHLASLNAAATGSSKPWWKVW